MGLRQRGRGFFTRKNKNGVRNNNVVRNNNTISKSNEKKNSNNTMIKQKRIGLMQKIKDRLEVLEREIKDDKQNALLFYKEGETRRAKIEVSRYKMKESEERKLNGMLDNLKEINSVIGNGEKRVMKGGDNYFDKIRRNLKLPNSETNIEVANKFIKKIQEEFDEIVRESEEEDRKLELRMLKHEKEFNEKVRKSKNRKNY